MILIIGQKPCLVREMVGLWVEVVAIHSGLNSRYVNTESSLAKIGEVKMWSYGSGGLNTQWSYCQVLLYIYC